MMKFSSVWLVRVVSILCFVCSTGFGRGEEPDPTIVLRYLRTQFDGEVANLNLPLITFNQKYRGSLEKQKIDYQSAGKLEAMLAVEAELKSFESNPSEDLSNFTDLNRLQKIYREHRNATIKDISGMKLKLIQSYRVDASKLAEEWTKAGKIEGAKLALAESKRFEEMENDPSLANIKVEADIKVAAGANLAKGKPYTYHGTDHLGHSSSSPVHAKLPDDGGVQLTNGLTMEESKDGADTTVSVRFSPKLEVIIDLGKSANLSRFRAFVGSTNGGKGEGKGGIGGPEGIQAPKQISIFGSNSKEEWTRITGLDKVEDVNGWIEAKGEGNFRYVKWQFIRSGYWICLSELEVYGE